MKRLLPHLILILSLAMLVFLVIDKFNSAMMFIDNDITKGVMTVLCVLAVMNSVIQIINSFVRKPKNRKDG